MTPHRRRWFASSLRALFVGVTLAAVLLGWVGYSLNWIRERRAMLDQIGPDPFGVTVKAPAGLWIFGEVGTDSIEEETTPEMVDVERRRLGRLFPEAKIDVHVWATDFNEPTQ